MKKLLLLVLLVVGLSLFSAFIPPVEDSYLTSTFGEFRSTGTAAHFHGGIDFSTFLREGVPIRAIYDGYLARIEIDDDNIYGNVVVLQHPNGYRSLYAHLSAFAPKIQKLVDNLIAEFGKQRIVVEFSEENIKFSQGDVIGYSGKTGEAVQPHAHVEIRDRTEETLYNPLDFIKIDPPKGEIVVKDLIINGKRYDYEEGKTYQYSGAYPKIAVNAYFQINRNLIGLNDIKLYFSNKLVYHIMFDSVPMSEFEKAYTVYTDDSIASGYVYRAYYKLYPEKIGSVVKENNFPEFKPSGDIIPVTIELSDAWGRKKVLTFNLRR
ncbi:M23 family metallopeptidase [Thermosipho ferrireducens]|uniref:M23 family metallopeptidase n=1 Tax=Thermosipho ferrireducens TaxID=2571116 RepID=A0ABX7S7K3_9BACT|nr:M23 family metallopeptidase [Thermosipho ferrireducens]QTA37607.1 M23 family metallopeptidase [Thermosipho ferrireducens]